MPGLGYPVRPVKGQLLVFGHGSTGPPVIVYRDHNYLLTKADGTVVLGGTMQEDGGYSMEADGRAVLDYFRTVADAMAKRRLREVAGK